jgi:hypothetical protein
MVCYTFLEHLLQYILYSTSQWKNQGFFYFQAIAVLTTNVADPDPVGSGPFWSDPDPDVWDRIRILGLINDPITTFLVGVKAINILGLPVA